MSTGDVTAEATTATPHSENGGVTPERKEEGVITTLLSSVKRKISQTLSPDSTKKSNEVGDHSNITSPEHKKPREGKKTRGKKSQREKGNDNQQNVTELENTTVSNSSDMSQEYDTEDELPLSDLTQKDGKSTIRQMKRPSTRNTKQRLGKLRKLLHRRQTPIKTRPETVPEAVTPTFGVTPPVDPQSNQPLPAVNTTLHTAINAIQADLKSIKLDGNKLGETVLNVQREIVKIRSEIVTKEIFDTHLTQMVHSVNAQLDAQKGEIDHNRGKVLDLQENLNDLKAEVETQFSTQEDHESRLESIEETVLKDLNSFRKELQGFENRISQAIPPTPFLPTYNDKAASALNGNIGPKLQTKSQEVAPPHENKNIIIEGLAENPLEDLERIVHEMLSEIGVNLMEADYNKMERLGKWNPNRNWPRPIKIELMTSHKKAKVLACRERLVQTDDYYRVRVNPDEPKETRVARAMIRQTANKARREGKQVNQTADSVTVNGIKYSLTTILEIGKSLNKQKTTGGHSTESDQSTYPNHNKYAEETCMLDTPRGMAFFTIRCMLSNFYPCNIRFNGRRYESAEHAYQAEKAIAARAFDKLNRILSAPTAARAKEIGREIPETPLWNRIKIDRMRDILNAKYRQNDYLGKYLCSIRGKEFIEANPVDSFWGAGVSLFSTEIRSGKWSGRNELGKLLAEIRDDLLREMKVTEMGMTSNKKVPPPPKPSAPAGTSTPTRRRKMTDKEQAQTTTLNRYDSLEATHISDNTFITRL